MKKMSGSELARRYLFFLVGLFVNSFGVSFITKGNLGTSPISSIPYTLSLGFAPSLGMFTLYMSVILIVIQMILLRKEFPKQYFLQIPVSLVFSYFIDFTMGLLKDMNPQAYWMKLLSLLLGCAILGFGVYMEMVANVVMLPGESFVNAVSKTFHTDFGKTKVAFDSSMVVIAVVISFVLFHRLEGVREGTVIAALLVGMIARFLKRKLGFVEEKLLICGEKAPNMGMEMPVPSPSGNGLVITVAREYGSSGRKIAKQIAEELHLAFHDNDIIQAAAQSMGMTEKMVQQKEQRITNRFFYDMLAQFYDQSDYPAMRERLNEAESEAIGRFAQEGNCVIVGRCADYVCKDREDCYHIFLYADENQKIQEIQRREHLSKEKARIQVRDIQKKRANHYKYFTGGTWGLAENYDLCIDTGKVAPDRIVRMVKELCALDAL